MTPDSEGLLASVPDTASRRKYRLLGVAFCRLIFPMRCGDCRASAEGVILAGALPAKAAHAEMFNYDLDAIFQDIKEQEKKSGLKFVSYPPRRIEPPPQPTETAIPVTLESNSLEAASTAEL